MRVFRKKMLNDINRYYILYNTNDGGGSGCGIRNNKYYSYTYFNI